MIHIGIIWANPYSNNLGVAALAYSSLSLINDICVENEIDADYILIGSTGKHTDKILIRKKYIDFINIKGHGHSIWKTYLKLIFYPKKFKTKTIKDLDIVFDISEGDSFTDLYGQNRFERFLNTKNLFNFLGINQVLLPQTIGPFKSLENERKAFKAMGKMEMVISRDKQSLDYSSKFLGKEKIMEAIDVAFYMPFEKTSFDPNKTHVGINISGLLWNGGYTRKDQFDLKTDYRIFIENALNYFYAIDNVQIHLVSHVINKLKSVEDDFSISEEMHIKYPNTILAPPFLSPIHIKSYISGLDFFFGSRMHACIAAYSSGVPVFPLAYSRKFNGLFGETLNYKWLGDCVNENEDIILENLKSSFNHRNLIKEEIFHQNNGIVADRLTILKKQLLKSLHNAKIHNKKN